VATKLFVGNLPFTVTSADLEELFSQAGAVTSANVIADKFTGKSRGFGFVEMDNGREAQGAIQRFHGYEFQGRALTVNEAKPQEPRFGGRRAAGGREHTAPGSGARGWGRASGGRERRW
jgi:RNA recognition motif-containing protein